MIAILSVAFAAILAPQSQSNEDFGSPIVVTATSVADAQKTLIQCLERNCPPKENINATIALVEAQFIGGDFASARQTAQAGMNRNRPYIAEAPVDFSELRRASARMAAHLGLIEEARHETPAN